MIGLKVELKNAVYWVSLMMPLVVLCIYNLLTQKSYFKAMIEYLNKHGKPLSFYTDRLNVFRVNNDKEGYRKPGLTQIGRSLKELGVELIFPSSKRKNRETLFNFAR